MYIFCLKTGEFRGGTVFEMLKNDEYEVFNLAQGGFTSFMDLFSLSVIGLYLEPDIIIIMEELKPLILLLVGGLSFRIGSSISSISAMLK